LPTENKKVVSIHEKKKQLKEYFNGLPKNKEYVYMKMANKVSYRKLFFPANAL
jgi:hypothetical protein